MSKPAAVREKLNFKNRNGNNLSAILEFPKAINDNTKFVLFAHCFGCSKNMLAVTRISKALADKNLGVMRFDFTGLGNSDGDFADTNFSSNIDDLTDAANYLRRNYNAPSILIGHSLGGAAVIAAAEDIDSCQAIVTIGAPSNALHVSHIFKDKHDDILDKGAAEIDISGNRIVITKQFIEDLKVHDFNVILGNLSKPLLIFHSPIDNVVEISEAASIYKAAKHPKSFISLDKADHMLSSKEDASYVADTLAIWASRYISAGK